MGKLLNKNEAGIIPLGVVLAVAAASVLVVSQGYLLNFAREKGFLSGNISTLNKSIKNQSGYLDEARVKNSFFDDKVVGTVILPNGSFSAYKVIDGEVDESGSRFVGNAKISFLSGDQTFDSFTGGTITTFYLKDGTKTTAQIMDKMIANLILDNETSYAIKILQGKVEGGRLTGNFVGQTYDSGFVIAGTVDMGGKIKNVIIKAGASKTTEAESSIAKNAISLFQSISGALVDSKVLGISDYQPVGFNKPIFDEGTGTWVFAGGTTDGAIIASPLQGVVNYIQNVAQSISSGNIVQQTGKAIEGITSIVSGSPEVTVKTSGNTAEISVDLSGIEKAISDGEVTVSKLSSENSASNGNCLTYDSSSGKFKWDSCGAGGGGTITTVTAGNGLVGGGTSGSVDLALQTISGGGLEATASGISLLTSCNNGQILKWNSNSKNWYCAADSGGGGGSADVMKGGTVVTSGATALNFNGSEFLVTDSPAGQANISISGLTASNFASGSISQWTNNAGYLTGNQSITLNGDVSGSGATSITTAIGSGAVTLGKMANLAANSIIGNNTGSAAAPMALTGFQVKTMLGISSSDVSGLGTMATQNANNVSITGGTLTGLTSVSATTFTGSAANLTNWPTFNQNTTGTAAGLSSVLVSTSGGSGVNNAGALTWGAGGTLGTAAYTASTDYATSAQGTLATNALPSASFTDAAVTGKLLTGYISGAGTITATDTILQAIQKLNGNDATNANLTGVVTSVGNTTSIANGAITNAMLANGAVANLSGTNTGDNAVNSNYSSDYRAANFVAGTNYLAPNGSGAALTGLTKTQVGLSLVENTALSTWAGSTNLNTIADKTVTLARMADMATASIIGRKTTGSGAPEILSASDVKTLLSIANTDVSGLGTMSTQNANNVSITGGSLSGLTSVAATTFTGALTGNASTVTNGVYTDGSYSNPSWITTLSPAKVLPDQTGNDGKVLGTNGSTLSWVTAGGAGTWGSITGTLSSQTDLSNALNAKLGTGLTSANIFVGNGSGVATGVALTGDVSIDNTGLTTIANNSVALGADTTGNYVSGATSNGGLALTGTEGATLGIALTTAADALSTTTSSGSGLELLSSGITLLQGCADGQLLKWNEGSDVWYCASDSTGGAGTLAIHEGGSQILAAAVAVNFASADFAVVDQGSNVAGITIDYTNSKITRSDQTQSISGSWTFSDLTISDTNVPLTGASLTLDFNNASDRTLTITNSSTGVANLSVEGTIGASNFSGSSSGTNTGDNAANSNYASDYRLSNFVAGTDYLTPSGSAANLTNFPTFNQNTTGTAAGLSAVLSSTTGGSGVNNAGTLTWGSGGTLGTAAYTASSDYATSAQGTLATNALPSASFTDAAVTGKLLTGYISGAGTVVATDTILQAIQKLNGNDATNANLTGVVTSVGNATSIANGAITNAMLANSAVANLSGTNTGDNAVNSNYSSDYRAANFVAGTNYLAPNGSAASLTNFPTFNQNTTGTASNITGVLGATSFPAMTGDVTNTQGSLSTAISSGAVTLAKMANLAANSIIGNNTGSAATPIALTTTQVSTMLGLGTISTQNSNNVSITGGSMSGLTSVSATTFTGALTGNASSATTATTATTANALTNTDSAGQSAITAINLATAGTINTARLNSSVTTQGNTFNGVSQLVKLDSSGYLPALNGSLLTNLTKSQVGLSSVENTALSTWAGSTNLNTIANKTVTLARMADMATSSFLGRNTAGSGAPEVLSISTAKSMLALTNNDISGLGTIATQSAGNVSISGGNISGINSLNGATIIGGSLSSTAVNGVTTGNILLSTGNYSNPSWLSGLTASHLTAGDFSTKINSGTYSINISGNAATATTATSATTAGSAGSVTGLSVTSGKILTVQKSMTFTSADDTGSYTLPTGTATLLSTTGSAANLTNFPTFNQNTTGTASNITGVLGATSFPAMTGDVTNTQGSLATAISSGAVTLGKMANLAANSIIGNNTGSAATPVALTSSQVKTLLGISTSDVSGLGTMATQSAGNIFVTGGQMSGLTSVSATTFIGALTGNADTVTNGVYTNGTYSNPSWITALSPTKVLPDQTGNNGKVLSTNGSTLSWITNSSGVAWGAITGTLTEQTDLSNALNAKLGTGLTSANIFVGNGSGVATGVAMTGDITIDNTGVTTIGNNKVTLAKIANIANGTILGNNSGIAGAPIALTNTQIKTVLGITNTDVSGLGSMSTQNANSVSITGGSLSGLTSVSATTFTGALTGNADTATAATTATTATTANALANTDAAGQSAITAINSATSGTINTARLNSSVTTQGNTFNGVSQLVKLDSSGYLPALNGSLLTNLTKSQVGLSLVENTALSTWTGSTNLNTIADKTVTLGRMADMATSSFIGRNTGGSGSPEVLSASTVKSMLALTNSDISGLGTIATQSAGNVSISGGNISGVYRVNGADLTGGSLSSTAVNGVTTGNILLSTGSYSNPSWLSGLTASHLTAGDFSSVINSGTYSINVSGTAGSAGSVTGLSVTGGKTLTIQKSMTFTSADDTGVYTLPTGTATLLSTTGSAANLTNWPTFNQNTTGTASNITGILGATSFPAMDGDVTNTQGDLTTTIASGVVTLGKMANLAANSIIGNNTGSAATPVALTATQVKSLLAIANTDVSGLGTMSTQNSNSVSISGGSMSGLTSVAATTFTGALTGNADTVTNGVYTTGSYADPSWITSISPTKVLPDQTGQNGKVLGTNGSVVSWVTNSSGVAWGAITGTLSDQSDLNTALSGKLGTGLTSANIFVGNGSGVATGVAMSGDITIDNLGATTIGNSKVTLGKIANIATGTILGNNSGSSAAPIALSASDIKTLLAIANTDVSGLGTMSTQNANSVNITGGSMSGLTSVAATTFTGSLTGNADTATTATTATTANALANSDAAGQSAITAINSASTGTINAARIAALSYISTTLNSANILVGNGSNVATGVSMSGDITIDNTGLTTIGSGKVSLSKMANLAANSIIGNNTGSAATPVALSASDVKTLLAIANTDVSGLGTMSTQNANSVSISGGSMSGLTSVAATTFTGALTGNASTATKLETARTIAGTSFDGSANVSLSNKFIVQGTSDTGLSGAQFLGSLGTGIVKNTTSTGVLSIAVANDFPTLNQNTTGTASNITGVLGATSFPAMTGDVTNTQGSLSTTIASGVVTLGKMANLAANSIIGNNTGSAATPIALTATQVKSLLAIANTDVSGLGTMSTQNANSVSIPGGSISGVTIGGTASGLTFAAGSNTLSGITASNMTAGDFSSVVNTGSYSINVSGSAGTVTGLSVTSGKTLTAQKTMTLTSADDTGVYTLPTGSKTLVATDVSTLSSLTSVGTLTSLTSSGTTTIGSGGNTFTFNPASAPSYAGTARPDRREELIPEYAGAVLTGTGIGTMTSDFCAASAGVGGLTATNTTVCNNSGNTHNYYNWTTSQGTAQTYSIYLKWRVPDNFSGWDTSNSVQAYAKRSDATNGHVNVKIYDTANVLNNAGGTEVAGAANTWVQNGISISGGTWTAGGYMTIQIDITAAATSGVTNVGEINLNYFTTN